MEYAVFLNKLFACFIGFQPYLNSPNKRKIIAKFFLVSTIPILFSSLGQYWFQWYGPYQTLNGLIVWFQKPLPTPSGSSLSLSGLFNNSNYAGQWLSMIFPFSIIFVFKRNKNLFLKISAILLTFLISYLVILTDSRNAFIGLIISILQN